MPNEPFPPTQEHVDEQKPSLAGLKILVIDDELDARELIRRILTQCDASVIAAASANEGLELVSVEKPDVIISDISMPEKNGYQLIAEVRNLSTEDGGTIPAIALTAFAHAKDKAKVMSAGYQRHLSKPVDSAELIAAINSLIEQH
jgi:CheY-like chemotaxis protein